MEGRVAFICAVIKFFIFITCLLCLSYQTAAFYRIFKTYPTAIGTEMRRNEPFTLPAVTFCYKNTVSRTKFCSDYPDLCEKPTNLMIFCHQQPHFCLKNISSLVIPKLGYYANYSSEANKRAMDYLFNDTGSVPHYLQKDRMKISFVEGEKEDAFAKCFSERLHLFDGDASLETINIDLSLFAEHLIGMYKLYIPDHESLYPWESNQVFFSIHSSFVPINPLREGVSVKPGYHYFAHVNLRKNYLLPYPYQTDCVNYNISWMKNNMTGPRSQDACKELCRSIFLTDCFGCDPGRIMTENPKELCTHGTKLHQPYYFWKYVTTLQGNDDLGGIPPYLNVCLPYVEAHQRCHDGCKPDCEKLSYEYSVVESAKDPSHVGRFKEDQNEADIQIYVKNAEILVMSHKPMYTNGDFYSYIGGLMGLWLGISVFTFARIAQKSFRRSLELKKKFHCQQEYTIKC